MGGQRRPSRRLRHGGSSFYFTEACCSRPHQPKGQLGREATPIEQHPDDQVPPCLQGARLVHKVPMLPVSSGGAFCTGA